MALRAGYIGLGNIGKPMASCWIGGGFETTVYDVVAAPMEELAEGGAVAAASPREVAERSDVVCICVPEDAHVRAVMGGKDGVLAGASPGTVVAIHSTILPNTVLELADQVAAKQVSILDACVTGGAARAGLVAGCVRGAAATAGGRLPASFGSAFG